MAPLPQPPPVPEHVDVTAGDPAPDPDCTGTYNRIEDHNDEHAYQRTTAPNYFLFWNATIIAWTIRTIFEDAEMPEDWYREQTIDGQYDPGMAVTGYPIASEVIPATP